jgi:hypothetical protein
MDAVTVLYWVWCWMNAWFVGFGAHWLLKRIFLRRRFNPRLSFDDPPEGKFTPL